MKKEKDKEKEEVVVARKSRGFIPAFGSFFTWLSSSLVVSAFWGLDEIDTVQSLFVFFFLTIYLFLDREEEKEEGEEESPGTTPAIGKITFFTCLVVSLGLCIYSFIPLGDLYEGSESFGTICLLMYLWVYGSIVICLILPEWVHQHDVPVIN